MRDSENAIFMTLPNISFPAQFEKIQITLELDNFTSDLDRFKTQSHTISEYCNATKTNGNCLQFLRFLNKRLNELELLEARLRAITRQKRDGHFFIPTKYNPFLYSNVKRLTDLDMETRKMTSSHIKLTNVSLSLHKTITKNLTTFISTMDDRIVHLEENETQGYLNTLIHLAILSSNEIFNYYNSIWDITNNKETTQLTNLINYHDLSKIISSINSTLSHNGYLN